MPYQHKLLTVIGVGHSTNDLSGKSRNDFEEGLLYTQIHCQ